MRPMFLLICTAVHSIILCRQRSREYHPDKYPDFPEDGKEALTEISRCVTEARVALSVPVQKPWCYRPRKEKTASFCISLWWDMIKQSVTTFVEVYSELEIKFNRLIYTVKSKWL